MTVVEVERRLKKIKASKDRENARVLENALHEEILLSIAEGNLEFADLPESTIKTLKLEFLSWYA